MERTSAGAAKPRKRLFYDVVKLFSFLILWKMLQLWATREFALRRNRSTRCRWDPHTYRETANWLVIEPQQRSAEEEIKNLLLLNSFFPFPALCSNTRYIFTFWAAAELSRQSRSRVDTFQMNGVKTRAEEATRQRAKARKKGKVNFNNIISREFVFISRKMSLFSISFFSPSSSSFLCRSSSSVVVPFGFLCVVGNKKVTKRSRRPICGRLDFSGGLRSAEFIAVQRKLSRRRRRQKKADPDEKSEFWDETFFAADAALVKREAHRELN